MALVSGHSVPAGSAAAADGGLAHGDPLPEDYPDRMPGEYLPAAAVVFAVAAGGLPADRNPVVMPDVDRNIPVNAVHIGCLNTTDPNAVNAAHPTEADPAAEIAVAPADFCLQRPAIEVCPLLTAADPVVHTVHHHIPDHILLPQTDHRVLHKDPVSAAGSAYQKGRYVFPYLSPSFSRPSPFTAKNGNVVKVTDSSTNINN